MAKHHVTATVNGDAVEFLCETQETLLDVLRDQATAAPAASPSTAGSSARA
jgi:aerobic-type carbon monoxide dehydrogenase small subunit (CoxS/CutS family)